MKTLTTHELHAVTGGADLPSLHLVLPRLPRCVFPLPLPFIPRAYLCTTTMNR